MKTIKILFAVLLIKLLSQNAFAQNNCVDLLKSSEVDLNLMSDSVKTDFSLSFKLMIEHFLPQYKFDTLLQLTRTEWTDFEKQSFVNFANFILDTNPKLKNKITKIKFKKLNKEEFAKEMNDPFVHGFFGKMLIFSMKLSKIHTRQTIQNERQIIFMEDIPFYQKIPIMFKTNYPGDINLLKNLSPSGVRQDTFSAFQKRLTELGYTCEFVEKLNTRRSPPLGYEILMGGSGYGEAYINK